MSNCTYDKQTITEEVFNFIYISALRDATIQKAFQGKKAWIKNVEGAKTAVRTHVCKLLNGEFKSETEHDESFLCTVRDVCNAVNENAENDYFTFGNAQKLINMSAKYAYTICLADPTYRERFRFCHCPMDLGMLDKVWYMHKGKFNEKRLGSHDSFCSSWSTETAEDQTFPDRYNKFQQAVKDIIANTEIYPIEFDYFEWGKDFQKKQSQNE